MMLNKLLSKSGLHAVFIFAAVFIFLANTVPIHSQGSLYQEAPMLAEQVKAGKLPSVDKRLPSNPVVVQPEEKVGTYGGTWHMAVVGDDKGIMIRSLGYEGLVRWDSQWTRIVPNLAQSYDVNADATEFTFHLREGVRWSDGESFTADDIMFWYQAVFLNKELNPQPFPWLIIDGKPITVEKKDNYTVIFRFAAPNGLFMQRLATPDGILLVSYPRHYLTQFHPDYNPNVADLVKQAGVKTWVELFQAKAPIFNFPINWEAPTLNPWKLSADYFTNDGVRRAERNPYYWKVDTDFNQLPYIDQIEIAVAKDSSEVNGRAINGQIDMQSRGLQAVIADPKNMQQGGYHTFDSIPSNSTSNVIEFNLNNSDRTKRAIFQNIDFRIGLSYAINRAKLSKLEPFQPAPVPESPLYNDRLAKQYTQYDVQKANDSLDKAGYTQRDADSFRIGPDGKRISFKVILADTIPGAMDPVNLIKQIQADWRVVGIDMSFEVIKRVDADVIYKSGDFDATMWGGDGGFEVILEPRYYFPFSNWSLYAPLWSKWFVNSQDPDAEEPPAIVKQQMQLYNQLQATGDPDKQIDIMKQIITIAADQFYAIGIVRPATAYGVVKNNFHNVASAMPASWSYPDPAPTNPCQYYIDPQP
ncbi:MAG: ABC transporter substrate-binding protein [Chloroflexota bacterium]